MPAPLLATKLFTPPPGRILVDRPRLLKRLDECLHPSCRLVLVTAPAGFGKTTLISTWISRLKLSENNPSPSIAWLSLENGDNNLVLFWDYVISALQTQQTKLGIQALNLLRATPPPDLDGVLGLLINDLSQLSDPFILILDDYHLVRLPSIHDSLCFLIEHAPSLFHIILSSRTDPPLPLALMRGRGQLLEFRMADLRFTADETAFFLNQTMRLVISEDDVGVLDRRTEGWITGLKLAALSMLEESDRHAFVTAFSGNDHYIADYLIDEVLQRQSEEVQRFLLQTSILEHLYAPLCEAVTGMQRSRELLNIIEGANLFVLPLDNCREWFRYHQLFADLLQRRLIQTYDGKRVKKLQRHAVDWLAGNGFLKLAVEYAVKYADYELASSLILSAFMLYIKDNELGTLLNIADRLPRKFISQNITLTCILAHAANATGHTQMAEQLIQDSEKYLGVTIDEFTIQGDNLKLPPLAKAGLIELGVIKARTSLDTFHLTRTFYLSEHLLPFLTPERDNEPVALNLPSNLRGPLLFTLGLAQKLHGDVAIAAQTFVEAAAEGKRKNNQHIEFLSLGHLGDALALQGRLRAAQKTFQETLTAPSEILQRTPFIGISRAGLGNLAYERNELETAEEHYRAAIEYGMLWHNWETLLPGYAGIARIRASEGNWQAAFTVVDELLENIQEKVGLVQTSAGALRALLDFRKGDMHTAERWAEEYEPERSCDYIVEWEGDALVGCRIWIARNQVERANKLLERIAFETSNAGRNARLLEATCLQAILYAKMCCDPDAIAALSRALEMGSREDYIRTFVDEGKPMAELLVEAVRAGIHPAYASRLLGAFPPPQRGDFPGLEGQEIMPARKAFGVKQLQPDMDGLIEPLSRRELEVILMIAEGWSNKEIAQKLYVSVRTVKYYTTAIYTKLGVHGRVQAVAKAQGLGLLK